MEQRNKQKTKHNFKKEKIEKRKGRSFGVIECPYCHRKSNSFWRLFKLKKNYPFGIKSKPIKVLSCRGCLATIEKGELDRR